MSTGRLAVPHSCAKRSYRTMKSASHLLGTTGGFRMGRLCIDHLVYLCIDNSELQVDFQQCIEKSPCAQHPRSKITVEIQ
jgi:hypothetical protein